jgi:hypothetical protein
MFAITIQNNRRIASVVAFLSLVLCCTSPASPTDLGDSVLRNYPSALTLPKKRLEISLGYLRIDDTIDIFDFRESAFSSGSKASRFGALGDMTGFELLVNYGLFDKTTLQSAFASRDIDYGFSSLDVGSYNFSVKQNINNKAHDMFPFLALDAGIRGNTADDQIARDEDEINAIIDRFFTKDIDVRINSSYVWFDKETENGSVSYGVPKIGKSIPQISTEDAADLTAYFRATTGRIWGRFFPNFYVEYGHTKISSKIDTTLTEYIPDELTGDIPELPIDLDRDENYLKPGISLLIKFPFWALVHLEYSYMKLFRDSHLDFIDYNHIFEADVNFFIRKWLVLNIGGVFYERQLNGIIPFLYNEYTQTTFDHQYGRAQIGLTFIFGAND